jgi:hypothetical protein
MPPAPPEVTHDLAGTPSSSTTLATWVDDAGRIWLSPDAGDIALTRTEAEQLGLALLTFALAGVAS